MKKLYFIFATSLILAACSADDTAIDSGTNGAMEHQALTFTTDIKPFAGETTTRTNFEGNAFMANDLIKLKIICPFVSGTQIGESTYSSTPDGWYYLKATGSSDPDAAWTAVTTTDGFDLTGSYSASNSPLIGSYYEAQQTPYVFTAETWTEEKHFLVDGSLTVQGTNVFHHDQRKEKYYLGSDVLWAQTIMQTGSTNFHLSFEHKMACLDITIDDSRLFHSVYNAETGLRDDVATPLTSESYLTLEKMPNIDQSEIVIGNYYADADKHGTTYGYRQKTSCSYAYNGKVIGVAEIVEANKRAKLRVMPGLESNKAQIKGTYTDFGSEIKCDGVYTAYKIDNTHFRLMLPPCTLTNKAVFWLRDGERRYSVPLELMEFESGKMYKVTLNVGEPITTPEP